MSLNYVTLILDLFDGQGNAVSQGWATLTASATLTDTADNEIVAQAPIAAQFRNGLPAQVSLLATDNGALAPSGWGWTISYTGVPGNPPGFSFFLPFSGGATQHLSHLSPVSSVVTMQAYMPLPTGTPSSGQVPVATGAGEASAWGTVSGGGGMTNPMTTLGDVIYENATPAAARLAGDTSNTRKFLRTQASGGVAQAPAWDTLQAGDVPILNQNTTGTAANITSTLDQVPAPAASVSLNSKKIISLANGSAASDAAAFGQIPAALPPNGAAGGDLGSTYPNPTVTATHLASALPVNQGGTGQATAAAAYNALSPMSTLGDIEYESGASTASRLAGNTSATKNFLTQTGTGSVSAAPAWGAIAAGDLPAATTSTQGAVILDGTAGDIKPTSTAAAAGAAGKAADASHVHAQNYAGTFGDGSDGTVTFDGAATVLGLVPAANVYTMTRDIFCTGITVNNGVTLKTNGWRVFCAGTVTNNGTISSAGGNATGTNNSTGGAAAGGAVLATFAGANGGTGAGAQASNSGTQWGTGTGNAGGTGSGGAGGSARAQRTGVAPFRNPAHALSGSGGWQGTAFQVSGGAGGSAGGGDGTNAGGGGGGGGGIVVIVAWAVNNGSGTISAAAGNGGTPGTGNCGGGGGGGGGLILVYTLAAWTAGTTSVAGGTLGSGVGTGTAGSAGSAGSVLNVVMQ